MAKEGRPPAFNSPEELQIKIDAYFKKCDERIVNDVHKPEPYTMSGLAVALGVDRLTVLNYSYKDEYFSTVKAARCKVEADVEKRLMEGQNQTGAIFNLKNNFNWVDKQERELSSPEGKPLQINVTKEEDKKRLEAL